MASHGLHVACAVLWGVSTAGEDPGGAGAVSRRPRRRLVSDAGGANGFDSVSDAATAVACVGLDGRGRAAAAAVAAVAAVAPESRRPRRRLVSETGGAKGFLLLDSAATRESAPPPAAAIASAAIATAVAAASPSLREFWEFRRTEDAFAAACVAPPSSRAGRGGAGSGAVISFG